MIDLSYKQASRIIQSGTPDELADFLQAGGDPNLADGTGQTLLMEAAFLGHEKMVSLLVQHGAALDRQDAVGYTAVHCAVSEYQPNTLELLLAAGARVDVKNRAGNTPLSTAIFRARERREAVLLLLRAGADPDVENNFGVSPRSLTKTISNYDLSWVVFPPKKQA